MTSRLLPTAIICCATALPVLAEDGQQAFNNTCRTCHTMKEGDNRQGPSLFGVFGRKAGTLAGYAFSPSMQQAGITWDEANLDGFIENPDAVVNGNAMKPYGGLADPALRKLIVEYLQANGK